MFELKRIIRDLAFLHFAFVLEDTKQKKNIEHKIIFLEKFFLKFFFLSEEIIKNLEQREQCKDIFLSKNCNQHKLYAKTLLYGIKKYREIVLHTFRILWSKT